MPINSFLYPGAKVTPAYEVDNSCMFNDNDTAYMHKTPSSSGNQRTFTFSTWWKQGDLASSSVIFASGEADGDPNFAIYYNSSQQLNVMYYEGSALLQLITTAVYRDPGGWYHICVAIDTTQGTASNRAKIYINGSQVTSFGTETYCNQNVDISINTSSYRMSLGAGVDNGDAADGYAAETVFIDGTAYAASSFGEFDEDSPQIFKPKDVSGLTFGTNGFYLDFEDSANLGNDKNGGTDLTEVNLAATDQMTDSPTNNFCTLNPLNSVGTAGLSTVTMSQGNLQALGTDDFDTAFGTIGVQNGVWYYEVECDSTGSGYCAGWTTTDEMQSVGASGDLSAKFVGFLNDIRVMNWNTEELADYGSISAGDILGLELDLDSGTKTLKCYHNGTLKDTANLPTDKGDTWIPIIGDTGTSDPTYKLNFGNPITSLSSAVNDPNGYGSFEYSTGSGYALCTKNLAEKG